MIRGEFHSLAVHIEIGDLVSSKMAFVEGAAVQIQVAVAERRERVPNQKLNPLVEGRAAILFLFATDQGPVDRPPGVSFLYLYIYGYRPKAVR